MEKQVKYLLLIATAVLATFAACDNYDADGHKFDNAVYLDVSKLNEVQLTIFGNNKPLVEKPLQATLAYPSDTPVTVTITADASLIATYNARYGTQWPMLDAKYYELSTSTVTIPAGKTTSEVITLSLKELMGEGEAQNGALPIDATYLLPVRIAESSMSTLAGSTTAYYVVKRSSAITTAAQLTDNWINFPTLDKYSAAGSMPWNRLRGFTYEALIYIDDFVTKDASGFPISISTIMGIEDYALLRLGDTNFEREQMQFDGTGVGFSKFPGRDATKSLVKGRWYHVACTHDQETRTVRIYLNGKIQSEAIEMGAMDITGDKNFIHLARRALYDLWNNETNEMQKKKYADLGYDGFVEARQFFISYSYNDFRPLNGRIAEARVWSVARTPEQIWASMYDVENPKDDASLLGYWKCNDGKGNTLKDYSQYGNDGIAQKEILWPDGIEIPVINKEE